MRVEEIMTKDVCSCSPGMNAATAAEIMWTRNCGSLPIVEDGGRVVGIVTDRDLFLALGTSNRKPAELPMGEIMSKDLGLCNPDNDVRPRLLSEGFEVLATSHAGEPASRPGRTKSSRYQNVRTTPGDVSGNVRSRG